MKPPFDPYEKLVQLELFAKAADQHIANLLKNQKSIVEVSNSHQQQIDELKQIIKELKNETT